jgi:hypothetical protein
MQGFMAFLKKSDIFAPHFQNKLKVINRLTQKSNAK